jgi:hypothetical protein
VDAARTSGSTRSGVGAGRRWPVRRCDDLWLVGLKLIFLVVTRAVPVLDLSRREAWWKDAGILMLRHQLAVAGRERPGACSRLTWPDRAWLALLAGTMPAGRLTAMRLIVTPATILGNSIVCNIVVLEEHSLGGNRSRTGARSQSPLLRPAPLQEVPRRQYPPRAICVSSVDVLHSIMVPPTSRVASAYAVIDDSQAA